jgi:hypothetical protein
MLAPLLLDVENIQFTRAPDYGSVLLRLDGVIVESVHVVSAETRTSTSTAVE